MQNVGLIGYGAIGRAIVSSWSRHLAGRFKLSAVLVRESQVEPTSRSLDGIATVVGDLHSLLETRPAIIIEAAGHGAVSECAPDILARGKELYILSVGALADDALRAELKDLAFRCGGRLIIPTGALAGFDGLLSLKATGLTSVKYRCVKPVAAWRGTAAEERWDLGAITSPQIVFSGTARRAAEEYPRNANLAAAVAFAGLGLDHTEVDLVADPFAAQIEARIEARSETDQLDVALRGWGFSENPKSSQITAMSAISALRKRTEPISFG